MVGPNVPASAACEKLSSPPAAGTPRREQDYAPRPRREPLAVSRITLPARGETPLSGDCGKTIPQTAFGGQLPLHKGAFYGAAAPRIEKSLDRTIKAFLWQREKDSNRLDAGSGNPAAVAAIHEVRVRILAPKPDGEKKP